MIYSFKPSELLVIYAMNMVCITDANVFTYMHMCFVWYVRMCVWYVCVHAYVCKREHP